MSIIGSILGIGGSLLSGIMGSNAEEEAAEKNYEIAMKNLEWDRERFNKMLEIALRQEKEGKLGYTDANGNRVYYVEGKGWVTELSPEQKILQELYRGEEKTQMGQDIPAKRRQMFENIAAQRREGGYADAVFEEMMRTRPQRGRDYTGIQNLIASEAIGEAYDPTLEAAMRTARRTGGTGAEEAAAIGRARGEDLRKAFLGNRTAGREGAYNEYATRLGNLANLYNTFRTRASAMPAVQYNPRNIEGQTADLMARAGAGGQQASGNLLNAYSQKAPQLNYQQPTMYGMANTFANLGNQLSQLDFSGFNFGGNYGSNNYAGTNVWPSAPSGGSQYQPGTNIW